MTDMSALQAMTDMYVDKCEEYQILQDQARDLVDALWSLGPMEGMERPGVKRHVWECVEAIGRRKP